MYRRHTKVESISEEHLSMNFQRYSAIGGSINDRLKEEYVIFQDKAI